MPTGNAHTPLAPIPRTSTPIGGPATDIPLVLLPIRLETRFHERGGKTELLVRVFPDDVHVDAHDARCTEAELTWGRHYWTQTWDARGQPSATHAAWAQLVEQLGAPRAAYISERLTPKNLTARPTTPGGHVADDRPDFPAVDPTLQGWSRAPYTRVLPEYWVAVGYVDNVRFVKVGKAIPAELALAPEMAAITGDYDADTLATDEKTAWLVDFSAAEEVGMALRIDYPAPGAVLRRLVVLGVKATITPEQGQTLLEELLQAHRYSDGLAFVPQGTPTNNTDEPSGYDSGDRSHASPLAESDDPTGERGSNGEVTARAVGIAADVMGRLSCAGAAEQRDAYHMNTALWRPTWGYFLEQLMAGPGSPTPATIAQVREHFSTYVRAGGPLPAWRVGRQPYGVLPAVSLDRWKGLEGGGIDAPIVDLLLKLRELWRRSLDAVPRVVQGTAAANHDLLKVFAMQPVSDAYTARPAQAVVRLNDPSPTGPVGSAAARQLAQSVGITWFPRHLRTLFAAYPDAFPLNRARIQEIDPDRLSASAALNPNYLAALLQAPWSDLRQQAGPAVLLALLLRHAALLEYVSAGARILLRRGLIAEDAAREPDRFDKQTNTPWQLLETAVPGLDAATVGAYLDALKPALKDDQADRITAKAIWQRGLYEVAGGASIPGDLAGELREFAAFARSLSYLSRQSTETLGRLLPATLDLASHRLDAWATSVATRRLEWLRRRTPHGIIIGGYGWIEDVVPQPRQPMPPPPPPADDPPRPELAAPLYVSEGNLGYVQAPSIAHATTAAILRSGHTARRDSDGGVLAVNLSSDRVRTARRLVEGVRAGQSLEALLGYQFERGLHENHPGLILDPYIPTFRALAAQAPGTTPAARTTSAQESIAAANVVDGLALLYRYRAGRNGGGAPQWSAATIPFGAAFPPLTEVLPPAAPANPQHAAICAELEALDDAVDAIADITVAEAVHQMAQGNPARAGAALDAIALGEAPAPDLDVLKTPRTGVGLIHRLVVLFEHDARPTWGAATPRAVAEPRLAAWVQTLFGPAAPGATCRVAYTDPASEHVLTAESGDPLVAEVTAADLGISPLDFVYLAEGAAGEQRSELEQRIAERALQPAPHGLRPGGVTEAAGVRLLFDRPKEWAADRLGMADLIEIARTVRRMLTAARPLAAADLELPDTPVPNADEADGGLELRSRAEAAVKAFGVAADGLLKAMPEGKDATIDPVSARAALRALADFGVAGAFPTSVVGDGPEIRAAVHAQAASVAGELRERLGRLEVARHAFDSTQHEDPAPTRDHHLGQLREVFGPEFRVLPGVRTVNPEVLRASFEQSTALQGGDPLQAVNWLQRSARVRAGVARLDAVLTYGDAVASAGPNLIVAQRSADTADVAERWIGLPGPWLPPSRHKGQGGGPPGGTLSIVAHTQGAVDLSQPIAGLLVDEWVEVVPSAEETTGLTFHFNRSNARAPQTILLAVTPDNSPAWDVETLEATIAETIELAKLRMVDLLALEEIGHYLPALYLPEAPGGQTVSADLRPLQANPTPEA
jgi:hypothetical protein